MLPSQITERSKPGRRSTACQLLEPQSLYELVEGTSLPWPTIVQHPLQAQDKNTHQQQISTSKLIPTLRPYPGTAKSQITSPPQPRVDGPKHVRTHIPAPGRRLENTDGRMRTNSELLSVFLHISLLSASVNLPRSI